MRCHTLLPLSTPGREQTERDAKPETPSPSRSRADMCSEEAPNRVRDKSSIVILCYGLGREEKRPRTVTKKAPSLLSPQILMLPRLSSHLRRVTISTLEHNCM